MYILIHKDVRDHFILRLTILSADKKQITVENILKLNNNKNTLINNDKKSIQ